MFARYKELIFHGGCFFYSAGKRRGERVEHEEDEFLVML